MRVLRRDECPSTPWKNGRGVAHRLAISPPAATHDDCEWQVSRTRIEADGPFSPYPGFDRQLVLLAGGGFALDVVGAADGVRFTHGLSTPFVPFAFRGDWSVHCRLQSGPSEVLNVFTRRSGVGASIDTLAPAHARPIGKPGGEALIAFVATGQVTVWGRWGETHLGSGDAAVVDEPGPEEIALAGASPDARVVAVRIHSLR